MGQERASKTAAVINSNVGGNFSGQKIQLNQRTLIRILTILILTLILISCDKADKIQGTWKAIELSQYLLAITNYGDAKFDKGTLLTFEQGHFHIQLTDTTKNPETFDYKVQGDQVVMWYSDYGIPLTIKNINDNELELETGGFGNTDEERKVVKNLKFIRVGQ